MNFKQIEALVYVNQHGTFKRAAEALYFESSGEEYITPESIQYRVKQLEQELGVTLYRKKQGSPQVRLTREGQLFLQEAMDVYQRMTEWRNFFLESASGILTMAATQTVIINRLHDPIMKFTKNHPEITLRAHNASAPLMEEMVAEGRIDFAFSTRPPIDNELEYIRWMETEVVLVTPKGHPLAGRKDVTLEQIADHPLVLLEPELHSDREQIDEAYRRLGRQKLKVALETSNSEILLSYVESGLGCTLISETSLLRNLRRVEVVRLGRQIARSEVGLLIREGQYLTTRAREFLSLVDPKFADWLKQRDALEEKNKRQRVSEDEEPLRKKK